MSIKKVFRVFGRLTLCVILLALCLSANAQNKDSPALYQKIKKLAYKHKFTTLVYNAVFTEPKPEEYSERPTRGHEGKTINPYLKFENKVIRHIYISVYDPFGYTVNDTITGPENFLEKTGNSAHIKTRKWVVNNKLLFKENDRVSALSISETERLLRQATFASDARIYITRIKHSDSVNVHVIVQDKWSITAPAEITLRQGNIRLIDQNILGFGHQAQQYVRFTEPGFLYFNGFYSVPNIDKTYISTTFAYKSDHTGTNTSLSVDRPFYSPLAKWAGGINVSNSQQFYSYTDSIHGTSKTLNVTNVGCDLWGGNAIKILHDGKFFNESNNLIIAGRYFTNSFLKRPDEAIGLLQSSNNSSGILGNVGFALQQYYKDKYIYRFGASEDVPEGLIVQFTYGGVKKEFARIRYYAGAEIARAKHFDFGYLSNTIACGMYFDKYYSNDITVNYKAYYFTDLLKQSDWYLRQFINYNFIHGEHKFYNESITITASDLYGFNSGSLKGKTKMVMDLETVAYAPYNLIGFKIAPVFTIGLGMLGSPKHPLFKSVIYQAYSLGIMFRNENLLNSTFQVSFGMYPYLPNGSSYAFKYNPITSFTIRVRPFAVNRPDFIAY